jgi:predicted DNA-binding protein
MSAKNLTLYIPGDVAQKMDTLREVNWSKVAREAIERYIEERLSTSIPAETLSKLRKEKGEEVVNGKKLAAEQILPNLTYKRLASFFKTVRIRAENARSNYAASIGVEEDMIRLDIEGTTLEIIKDHFTEIPKDATDEFCKGAFSLLNETWEALQDSKGRSG